MNTASLALESILNSSNISGATGCITCEDGYISTEWGSTSCSICPAGTYEYNHKNCYNCPEGTYSNISGATNCIPCPKNKYSNEYGSTICLDCPENFCSDPGSSNCYNCE